MVLPLFGSKTKCQCPAQSDQFGPYVLSDSLDDWSLSSLGHHPWNQPLGGNYLGGHHSRNQSLGSCRLYLLLGIPTMFGYSLLKAVKFFLDGNVLDFNQFILLLLASVTAFVVSLFAIRFLTDYVKKHDFTIFGKYRIGLGALLIVYSLVKWMMT